MKLESWDLKDPARLIEEISERRVLVTNTVHLGVVADPSTYQRLTHVETLPLPAVIDDYERSRDVITATVRHRLPVPQWRGAGPRHTVVTVVVREGFTVFGRNEEQWVLAWRYSNHCMDTFNGTIFLVTEHGWYDWESTWGGHEPRSAPRPEDPHNGGLLTPVWPPRRRRDN